jgi:hypothetical protein
MKRMKRISRHFARALGEAASAPALRQLNRRDILGGLIHEYERAA